MKPPHIALELSNNPWKCTCGSEINDRVSNTICFWSISKKLLFFLILILQNLLEKVTDRQFLTCGPGSDVDLAEKKVSFPHLEFKTRLDTYLTLTWFALDK